MIPFVPKKPTATIPHPGNDHVKPGEISLVVRKPSSTDRFAYGRAQEALERFQPAIDPTTGKPFLDATGAVRALRVPAPTDISPQVNFLERVGVEVLGLCDSEGQPLKVGESKMTEAILFLFDPVFLVPIKRRVPVLDEKGEKKRDDAGQVVTEEKDMQQHFPTYAIDRIFEEGTFGDPLGRPTSEPSAGSSSAS